MTLDDIVSDYIREYRDDARAEMQTFRREKSRAAAIRRAALCEFPDGNRHPHQYLIPQRLLALAEERLQAAARRLGRARDFAALHEIVKHEIGSVHGIGRLMVYGHRAPHWRVLWKISGARLPAPGNAGRSGGVGKTRRNTGPRRATRSVLAVDAFRDRGLPLYI